jgi:DNA ligase-1
MKKNVSRRSAVARAAWVLTGWAAPSWSWSTESKSSQTDLNTGGVMLATPWVTGADPAAYWVSEKLDGVRAVWDGQSMRFRSGRPMAAPAWFIASLPPIALDGELWLGRGTFDRLSATVRRETPVEAQWREVLYQVFDLPGQGGTFSERLLSMKAVLAARPAPFVQALPQFRVANAPALAQQLQQVVQGGGEGLVLHHTDAHWQAGRSDFLHKLKAALDEDARVIGHVPGKGRLNGRVGALLVETPNGQRFALGSGLTDAKREKPPEVGAWVTYRYRDRTPSGLPRFASFLRERPPE